MTENQQPDLISQFRELGENLKSVLQTAWESEEAQQFKEEIKDGLEELGNAASDAVRDFNTNEAGNRIRSEAKDIRARIESGELESKARLELSKVLDMINSELQKTRKSFSKSETDPEA